MLLDQLIVELGFDPAELREGISEAIRDVEGLGERMVGLGGQLTAGVTVPLATLGAASVAAFGEQEDAIAKLDAVLAATGTTGAGVSGHIQELAASLQETTRFGDDATESAAAVLLAFDSMRDGAGGLSTQFDRTLVLSQDLAAFMETDVTSAAKQLGRALEDPKAGMAALRRAGVVLNDEQKAMIEAFTEAGDVAGAQGVILDALEGKIGGLAQTMGTTMKGEMAQAWNALGEAGEAVGALLAPVIKGLADAVSKLATFFAGLPTPVLAAGVAAATMAAAIGPLLIGLGGILKLLPLLQAGMGVLGATGGPILLAVVAISSLVAAGTALVENWQVISYEAGQFTSKVTGAFREMYEKVVGHSYVPDMVDGVGDEFGRMGEILERGLGAVIDFTEGGKGAFRGFAESVIGDLKRTAASLVGNFIGGAIRNGVPFFIGGETLGPVGPRALGGPVTAGAPYLVGERGPELFVPGASGTIVPNGGGGMSGRDILSALGPPPRAMSPREVALDGWWREVIRLTTKDNRERYPNG